MPKCVLTGRQFDWGTDSPPGVPMDETVIYETHVKGLTRRHPDVPEHLRGTYAGLAHPAVTGYLTDLGVTAVELLPVHQFVHDAHLLERGLRNYWGYNSIGFLAPHGGYSSAGRVAARWTSSSRWSRLFMPPGSRSSSTSSTTIRPKATTSGPRCR